MLMRWPSGSALATYFAATTPPAPRRFSTITGTPRLADIFSATTRAIVSDALPGVTPETRRTVLPGKVCALTAENATANSNAKTLTGVLLDFWQSEALRQPVGRAAAIAVRTVVGVVAAVLDHQQLDRPGHRFREHLGVRRRHQAVLASGDDEDRAGDVLRRVLQRQFCGISFGFIFIRGMAAQAESASGELWQPVPDLRPVERTRERDAGLEALLVGRGARRVVAAEAHAPDRDSFSIEIIALFDPIHNCARRALVVAADRDLVLGLALPRAVDRQRRHAAVEEGILIGMQLFLSGVQSRGHHHYGAFAPQYAVESLALERYRYAFPRWPDQRQRVAIALDRLHVRGAHLRRVLHEHELGEVIVDRRAHEVLAGREPETILQ